MASLEAVKGDIADLPLRTNALAVMAIGLLFGLGRA
jgi:hypothetical protein